MTDLLSDPQLTWYVARATGVICLVLLTMSLVLGIGASTRVSSARWPRFVTQSLHRSVSLFAVALLAVHVASVVLDDYVRITVTDAFVPFVSVYRPIWLGLGSLASDLLLAVTVTSLLRHRIGYGTWRAVHWTSYACWPLAVVHGLGTGTDTRKDWNVWVTIGCVALVLLAFAWRVVDGWPRRATVRVGAALVAACAVAVVFTWAKQGPFAPNWSKRANTPPPVVGAR